MKKLSIFSACLLLLTGCIGAHTVSGPATPSPLAAVLQPAGLSASEAVSRAPGENPVVRDKISRPKADGASPIDPPYDFDPAEMLPRDFGEYFLCDYPTDVSGYLLAEGTDVENEVTVLKGRQPGPVVYVVAGVHGDEIAAWMTGNLLKKINLKAGELRILSPANRWGAAAEPRSRYVTERQDLNRAFPGDAAGTMAQRAAHAIYEDIKKAAPVFLFDLHEARAGRDYYDFLGSSFVFSSAENVGDLYFDMALATESGELCSEQFDFFSPGPAGSINRTATERLGIPTLTVETYRGYPLERRIGDQLDAVEYVLTYYGLL